jgi:hypothetical protein
MYLSTSYNFAVHVLRNYYAAFLHKIELGSKTWADDFSYLDTAMLNKDSYSAKPSQKFGSKKRKKKIKAILMRKGCGFARHIKETSALISPVIW